MPLHQADPTRAPRPGTKEFVLQAPPDPRTKYVEVDPGASQTLINFMIGGGFMCKRIAYLYGKWVDDAEGQPGVPVCMRMNAFITIRYENSKCCRCMTIISNEIESM